MAISCRPWVIQTQRGRIKGHRADFRSVPFGDILVMIFPLLALLLSCGSFPLSFLLSFCSSWHGSLNTGRVRDLTTGTVEFRIVVRLCVCAAHFARLDKCSVMPEIEATCAEGRKVKSVCLLMEFAHCCCWQFKEFSSIMHF